MAVKIRLMRVGQRKQPSYRVVVADSRSPRDGRFIEQIGRYDPRQDPSVVEIDNDKALDWLEKGAQPTDAVRKLLEITGAWGRFQVTRGGVHVVADQGGETPHQPPEEATASDEDAVGPAAEDEGAADGADAADAAHAAHAAHEGEEEA